MKKLNFNTTWFLEKPSKQPGQECYTVWNKNGRICSITNGQNDKQIAKLIQAAPELLEACIKARNTIKSFLPECNTNYINEVIKKTTK